MSCFYHNSFIKLILLISVISQLPWALLQQTTGGVSKNQCAAFKRETFEKIYTYSAFVVGLPDFETTVDHCKKPQAFIIGGSPANAKEFPHMARLGFAQEGAREADWVCGGTLISKKFVLTAAHCFHSPKGILNRVRLGELVFNSNTDDARPEDFDVLRNISHPDYREDQLYNDIGLVELARPVVLSEYITPACLPSNNGDNFDLFCAVGWGATKFARADSDVLLKVTLNRYDANRCSQFTDNVDDARMPLGLNGDSQICAGSTEPKDACHGDSGGPLLQIHNEFSCMHSVFGITSWGFGCGIAGVPGIYTRVYHYINWIEGIVW